jgi:hypothetical protein
MANTLSSNLVLDTLSQAIITTLGNRLAPLNAFSKDFSADGMKQNASVQVPKATTGSAIQTNPTNFETGDTTMTNVNVLVQHYSKSFHLTSESLNQGFRLENLAEINAQIVANKLIDVALAPVTATNFPTNVTVAQASFVAANVKTLWAAASKSMTRNLILDSVAYSQLLPTDKNGFPMNGTGGYGFDAIYLNTRWTGAGTNIYGFACGPEAIAVAAGLPIVDPSVASLLAAQRNVTIPELGLVVQISTWGSLSSRSAWASMDVMFGAALGDNTAVARAQSA